MNKLRIIGLLVMGLLLYGQSTAQKTDTPDSCSVESMISIETDSLEISTSGCLDDIDYVKIFDHRGTLKVKKEIKSIEKCRISIEGLVAGEYWLLAYNTREGQLATTSIVIE